MTYKEEVKDLFSVSNDYYLAHCISADFGMGAGIAVEFNKKFDMRNKLRTKYPKYLEEYKGGGCILEGKVLNLVTKERCYYKPTLMTMETALQNMLNICLANNINKIAMPTIGAGLDCLNWNDVSEQIKNVFKDSDIEILVCKWK